MRARVYGWRDFCRDKHVTAWDQLAQLASEPNPFYESWLLLPALEQFDPDQNVQFFVLEAEEQLIGLLPLQRELTYYGYPLPHLRNWTHTNCFLGAPLVMKGCEPLFWVELFRWADANVRLALFLHLTHTPSNGTLNAALQELMHRQNRPAANVMQEERAMLQSKLSPDAYFEQSLSTKKRKELRRQERRLAELGRLEFEQQTDCEEIGEWSHQFLALEARGWKGRSGSALASDSRTSRLFDHALAGAARRGRLARLTMRLDGRPIAMLANFLTPPGAFSFKTAFDEDYARFSPGVLLQHKNLQILHDPGVDWIDSCAASDHPMIDHIWRERRTISRYSIGIGGAIRRSLFKTTVRFETGAASGGI